MATSDDEAYPDSDDGDDNDQLPSRTQKQRPKAEEHWTDFDLAVWDGRLEEVKRWLKKRRSDKSRRGLVQQRGQKGVNAVMVAATRGLPRILKLLITSCGTERVNLNMRSSEANRCTALHFAASNGHQSSISILHAHGADLDSTDKDPKCKDKDVKGLTPLAYASQYGRIKTLKMLLDLGAGKEKWMLQDALTEACVAHGARDTKDQMTALLKETIAQRFPPAGRSLSPAMRGSKRDQDHLGAPRYPVRKPKLEMHPVKHEVDSLGGRTLGGGLARERDEGGGKSRSLMAVFGAKKPRAKSSPAKLKKAKERVQETETTLEEDDEEECSSEMDSDDDEGNGHSTNYPKDEDSSSDEDVWPTSDEDEEGEREELKGSGGGASHAAKGQPRESVKKSSAVVPFDKKKLFAEMCKRPCSAERGLFMQLVKSSSAEDQDAVAKAVYEHCLQQRSGRGRGDQEAVMADAVTLLLNLLSHGFLGAYQGRDAGEMTFTRNATLHLLVDQPSSAKRTTVLKAMAQGSLSAKAVMEQAYIDSGSDGWRNAVELLLGCADCM